MGFNVKNWAFVPSGASNVPMGFWFNNGSTDEKAQYAQGSPQDNGGSLVTNNFEKVLDLQGKVIYQISVSNNGSDTWMELEGGGLS
jgi:hypothetical protein